MIRGKHVGTENLKKKKKKASFEITLVTLSLSHGHT